MKDIILIAIIIYLLLYFVLLFILRKKYLMSNKLAVKDQLFIDKFASVGIFIQRVANISFKSRYSKFILSKLETIYGIKNAKEILKIIMARKINFWLIYIWFCLIFIYFKGIFNKELSFIIVLGSLGIFANDYEIIRQAKNKKRQLLIEFPEFINKIILLLNAGLVFRNAWEKAVADYYGDNPFYLEARKVIIEIKSGLSEVQAYENFAKRCGLSQINKFVLTIIQNHKMGNKDIIFLLKYQAEEAWETRKNIAKTLGEEATTKIILPMILIFIAILIFILAPVILNLSKI